MIKAFIKLLLRSFGYDVIRFATSEDVRVLTQGVVVAFGHGGERYRMFVGNLTDSIQRHHLFGRIYETEELAIIARAFPRGGVLVDVGANVGNHTVFAAKALGARRVLAFEPAAPQKDILVINVALNDLSDRVSVFRLGLSDAPGTGHVEIPSPATNLGGARLSEGVAGEPVRLERGDDVIGDLRVDFLKIDVEGHELAVLEGLAGVIANSRPQIFVEVDNDNLESFHDWVERNRYVVVDTFKRHDVNTNFLLSPA